MIKAVLFDLDGTLLRMDQEAFLKDYFGRLSRYGGTLGYDPDLFLKGVWKGSGAMLQNDGTQTNEEVFWGAFAAVLGICDARTRLEGPLEEFYKTEFPKVAVTCGKKEASRALVDGLRALGIRVILATNPLFPAIATRTRMEWAGLDPEAFERVTTYENSRFCKPNPAYYKEILDAQGLTPEECLMVGNDATEDGAAEAAGIRVFLLTEELMGHEGLDLSGKPQGNFDDLHRFFEKNLGTLLSVR